MDRGGGGDGGGSAKLLKSSNKQLPVLTHICEGHDVMEN